MPPPGKQAFKTAAYVDILDLSNNIIPNSIEDGVSPINAVTLPESGSDSTCQIDILVLKLQAHTENRVC